MIDQTDLAYIAGFFDGEGSIVITPSGGTLELNVSVVNTDRAVIEMIRAALHQRGGVYNRPRTGIGTKPVFVAQWSGAAAENVLRLLYPYLRVKKGRAEVALRFRSTFTRRHCGVGIPAEVAQLREELRTELRQKNN